MRLMELDSEYVGEMYDATMNILYTARAEGISEISSKNLVADLEREGYFVNISDLIDMLDGNPSIETISQDSVVLADMGDSDEEYQNKDAADKTTDVVKKLARDQVKKDL